MKYISTTNNKPRTSEILNKLFGYFAMSNCSTCYKNLNSVYCCEYKLDTMYLYTYILLLCSIRSSPLLLNVHFIQHA